MSDRPAAQVAVDVLLLTGPPAAGKNTVGRAVADRLPRSALVDADQVRAFVRRPHVAPWYGGEGDAQLRLGAQNVCGLARSFAAQGFKVVALDFLTEETLALYRGGLRGLALRVVRLLPSLEEAQRRNRERGLWVHPVRVDGLYAEIAALPGVDETIDNTAVEAEALGERLAHLFEEDRRAGRA